MQRDNRIVGRQRIRPKCAFGDRKAQQNGIGEKAGETDGDRIFPVAFKQVVRAEKADEEAGERPGVKTDQQR